MHSSDTDTDTDTTTTTTTDSTTDKDTATAAGAGTESGPESGTDWGNCRDIDSGTVSLTSLSDSDADSSSS